MDKITRCPSCGSLKIKQVRQDWTGKHNSKAYRVPELEYYECSNCGEKLYDRAAMRRIEAASPAYVRRPHKKRGVSIQLCKLLNSTKHRRWTDGTSTTEAEESTNT